MLPRDTFVKPATLTINSDTENDVPVSQGMPHPRKISRREYRNTRDPDTGAQVHDACVVGQKERAPAKRGAGTNDVQFSAGVKAATNKRQNRVCKTGILAAAENNRPDLEALNQSLQHLCETLRVPSLRRRLGSRRDANPRPSSVPLARANPLLHFGVPGWWKGYLETFQGLNRTR